MSFRSVGGRLGAGRWALAATALLSARTAAAAPEWSLRALERGIAWFRAADYPRALVELSVAARGPGIDPAVHLYLGYTLYKLERHEEATTRLRRALAEDPSLDGPLPRFYLGLSLYRRRLYLLAREELERVVKGSGRGRLAAQAGEFLFAIEGAVVRGGPGTASAHHQQALAALAGRRPSAAAEALEEELRWLARVPLAAAEREDRRREATLYLVGALCLASRCPEARERLRADPARAASERLRFARGMVLAGTGSLAAARELLQRIEASATPRLRAAARVFLRTLESEAARR